MQDERLVEKWQRQPEDQHASRKQEKYDSNDFYVDLGSTREFLCKNIDPHMLVAQKGIASRQQENRAEQIPLQLKPGIGADAEHLADHRIGSTDDDDNQRQPYDNFANSGVNVV